MADEGEQEFFNKVIKSCIKRALGMLEDLLDYIRVEAGKGITFKFEEINMTEIVMTICRESQINYDKETCYHLPSNVIMGVFDRAAIFRVLESLISNAIKYGDVRSDIDLNLEEQGDQVIISVHNYGNPIPKDKQEEIFDFLTTSPDNSQYPHKS